MVKNIGKYSIFVWGFYVNEVLNSKKVCVNKINEKLNIH
jgi:hypothetical protein